MYSLVAKPTTCCGTKNVVEVLYENSGYSTIALTTVAAVLAKEPSASARVSLARTGVSLEFTASPIFPGIAKLRREYGVIILSLAFQISPLDPLMLKP
jgi:hypothetical protein